MDDLTELRVRVEALEARVAELEHPTRPITGPVVTLSERLSAERARELWQELFEQELQRQWPAQ